MGESQSSGGELKFTGSCTDRFEYGNTSHEVRLVWERFLLKSVPYTLYIDDEEVIQTHVIIENWRTYLLSRILIIISAFIFASVCTLIGIAMMGVLTGT